MDAQIPSRSRSCSEGTCANLFGIYESSGMLRSRVVSAQLQSTKKLSTGRQVPHRRTTDDERYADLSEALRTWVWLILECEWSHNSPWTARESRGPLVHPLVAPRGTAAHVHHGCGHPLGALASASRSWPTFFFVGHLCCPDNCHFVFCRWWCVAPLFLWARVGQVLGDVLPRVDLNMASACFRGSLMFRFGEFRAAVTALRFQDSLYTLMTCLDFVTNNRKSYWLHSWS